MPGVLVGPVFPASMTVVLRQLMQKGGEEQKLMKSELVDFGPMEPNWANEQLCHLSYV